MQATVLTLCIFLCAEVVVFKPQIAGAVQPESPSHSKAQQTKSKQADASTKAAPAANKKLPGERTKDRGDETKKNTQAEAGIGERVAEHLRHLARDSAASLALAGFVAFIAVLQVVLFRQQLETMNRGLVDSAKSSEAAKMAAEAAKLSAESLQRAERAYVFARLEPNSVGQTDMLLGVDRGVSMYFANRGKTPAIPITLKYALFASNEVPTTFPESAITRQLPNAWATAAGEDFHNPVTADLPSGIPEEVRTGKLTLYCCGVFQYDDVFGNGWNTGFCWQYIAREHRFKPADSYQLNYHAAHKRIAL